MHSSFMHVPNVHTFEFTLLQTVKHVPLCKINDYLQICSGLTDISRFSYLQSSNIRSRRYLSWERYNSITQFHVNVVQTLSQTDWKTTLGQTGRVLVVSSMPWQNSYFLFSSYAKNAVRALYPSYGNKTPHERCDWGYDFVE